MQNYKKTEAEQKKLYQILELLLKHSGFHLAMQFEDGARRYERQNETITLFFKDNGMLSVTDNATNNGTYGSNIMLFIYCDFIENWRVLAMLHSAGVIDIAANVDIETNNVKNLINEKMGLLC